jgi:endonuclease/exonuclease/phosphatase family metal-dependent hydrolase
MNGSVPPHKFVSLNRGGDKYCEVCNLFLDSNGSTYNAGDRLQLTDGADIRIMSFNILSEEWDSTTTLAQRVNGVVTAIRAYGPDVIGVQEVSQKWYAELKKLLGDEYVFVNSYILGHENYNYSALAYRKDSVKLIESDVYFYSVYNSQRIRLINFGLFERLSDGKRFGTTCTHYNANHNNRDHTPERKIQATEFLGKIKEYYAKYNCPIFCTGDFNCSETTEPYKITTSEGVLQSSKFVAEAKGLVCSTTHSLGTMPGAGPNSIDHIFFTGNTTALYYTTIVDDVTIAVSDHTPIYCDFKLN